MGNYEQLKQAVADVIKTNGNQEITGEILQNALLSIISTIGTNATFAGIATPTTNPGTPDQNVFYIASENGTYSNFGSIILSEEVAILSNKGSSWVKSSTGIATSAKVTELEKEVIYDVTTNNDGATFASLSELLSDENLSTLIPISVRCGGMSIRFMQSSDNKYVQYRLMSDTFNTTSTNWQGVDDVPTTGSDNLVKSGGVHEVINGTSEIVGYTEVNNLTQKAASGRDAYYITPKPSDGYIDKMFVKVGTGTLYVYVITAPNPGGAITTNNIKNIDLSSYQDGSVIEIQIGRQLKSDQYIGLGGLNAFYFGQAEGWNLYRDNGVAPNYAAAVYYTGRIHGGIVNQITNLEEKTDYIEEQVEPLIDKEIYNPTLLSENAYSSSNGYSVCIVPAGTVIKSVKVCSPDGTTPVLEFAELINDTLYGRARFTLNAGAGSDTYVETEVNYECKTEQYVIIRNGFYFEILETTENIPYLVGNYQYDAPYASQQRGRVDLNYKMVIISSGELEALFDKVQVLEENDWTQFAPSDLSMIETMGCCGDSYTAGMIALGPPYVPSSITYERKNLSWGKVLERHFGIDVSVYAKGAMTVKTYLTDAACLPLLLSESAKKLYAISLGHNDMYLGTTVGDISSLDGDWKNYPDNFIGNYGRIIEQIQEHAPNAFIILMRQSKPYCLLNNGAELNQAISDLGVHYGIPVLNPEDDPYLSSNVWTNTMVRRHPIFAGYAGMAMAFARQFNAATVKYWEYFIKYGIN